MKTIAQRIRTRAAEQIIEDIRVNGRSVVFNAEACITKVREELGIELTEKHNENGKLIGILILA
jgi:hypothetical protein